MKSVLLIALVFGQTLLAAESPTYEGMDINYKLSYPELQQEEKTPEWVKPVAKTVVVASATVVGFVTGTLATFGGGNDYAPLIGAGVAGAASYVLFDSHFDSE